MAVAAVQQRGKRKSREEQEVLGGKRFKLSGTSSQITRVLQSHKVEEEMGNIHEYKSTQITPVAREVEMEESVIEEEEQEIIDNNDMGKEGEAEYGEEDREECGEEEREENEKERENRDERYREEADANVEMLMMEDDEDETVSIATLDPKLKEDNEDERKRNDFDDEEVEQHIEDGVVNNEEKESFVINEDKEQKIYEEEDSCNEENEDETEMKDDEEKDSNLDKILGRYRTVLVYNDAKGDIEENDVVEEEEIVQNIEIEGEMDSNDEGVKKVSMDKSYNEKETVKGNEVVGNSPMKEEQPEGWQSVDSLPTGWKYRSDLASSMDNY